jgi:hypothetical protein
VSAARSLTSDELGAKGEGRFRELCADAKLTCNSSDRDRTGWDFIVQFPFQAPYGEATLDQRSPPASCYFQIKTMWDTNDAFKTRLSSVERLAKERYPAFIYVLKINAKLEFVDAYLMPMLDEILSTVLRRLRSEQMKGSGTINNTFISFRPSRVGIRIPTTGDGLRAALLEHVGTNLDAVIKRKTGQIESLGFKEDRRTIQMKLRVSDMEHVVDVFLGLKEAELAEFKSFETRFGIRLPLSDNFNATQPFKITPIPADKCRVSFRGAGPLSTAVFKADIIVPAIPNVPDDLQKTIIRSPFIEFIIHNRTVSFSTRTTADIGEATPTDWISFFRMISIISKGEGNVTFVRDSGKTFSLPLSTANGRDVSAEEETSARQSIAVLETMQRLLRLAGANEPKIRYSDVEELTASIMATEAIVSDTVSVPPLVVFSHSTNDKIPTEEVDALFVNYLPMGQTRLTYSVIVQMRPDASQHKGGTKWASRKMTLIEFVAIPNEAAPYEAFLDRTKTAAKPSRIVWRDPNDKTKLCDRGFD